jgi:hypothetical protein
MFKMVRRVQRDNLGVTISSNGNLDQVFGDQCYAFEDEIKFFHHGIPMKRHGTLRRKALKPCGQHHTFCALEKIRVGNPH